MRWFRFYNSVVNDPKVQRLEPATFRAWVNILCLASENAGKIPSEPDLCFALRLQEEVLSGFLTELEQAGLLDRGETGLEPHNWAARQYKSDVSTERVKRFRNGERNTPRAEAEAEAEPETEQSPTGASSPAKTLFDQGVAYLRSHDITDKHARSIIGKLRSRVGEGEAIALISAAMRQEVSDPVPWLERAMRNANTRGKSHAAAGKDNWTATLDRIDGALEPGRREPGQENVIRLIPQREPAGS